MRRGEGGYVDEIAMMRRKDMDMFFISSINHPSFFSGQLLNFPGCDRRISEPSTLAPENFGAFLRRI